MRGFFKLDPTLKYQTLKNQLSMSHGIMGDFIMACQKIKDILRRIFKPLKYWIEAVDFCVIFR